MRLKISLLITLAVTTVAFVLSGCGTVGPGVPRSPKSFTITLQPESHTKQVNSLVVFAVRVHPERGVTFQWRRDGKAITGETKREFFIEHASPKDVAGYSVEVRWDGITNIISDEAFLQVYSLRDATAGTLTMSARQFKGGSKFRCPTAGDLRFERELSPSDAAGRHFQFSGPTIRLGDQLGPFMNWPHGGNLRVDVGGINNLGVPVGVQLNRASGGKWIEMTCQAGVASTDGPRINRPNLPTDAKSKDAQFGVTVYLGNTAPKSGNVELNWQYY